MAGRKLGPIGGRCCGGEYPGRIVPYPPLSSILSERDGGPMSKEDSEMLLWLAEIRSQMARQLAPAELEFLQKEERGVERYFNNRRFADHPSMSVLADRSYEAGLSGVFVREETRIALDVDQHSQAIVGVNMLTILDNALRTDESKSWDAGLVYLLRYLRIKSRIQRDGPASHEEADALSHSRTWMEYGDVAPLVDASARALLIYLSAESGSASILRFSLGEDTVRSLFSMVRMENAGEEVFGLCTRIASEAANERG